MGISSAYIITTVAVLLLFGVFSSRLSSRLNMPVLLLFLCAGMLIGCHRGVNFGISADPAVSFANNMGTIAMAFILYSGGLETDMRNIKKILLLPKEKQQQQRYALFEKHQIKPKLTT